MERENTLTRSCNLDPVFDVESTMIRCESSAPRQMEAGFWIKILDLWLIDAVAQMSQLNGGEKDAKLTIRFNLF